MAATLPAAHDSRAGEVLRRRLRALRARRPECRLRTSPARIACVLVLDAYVTLNAFAAVRPLVAPFAVILPFPIAALAGIVTLSENAPVPSVVAWPRVDVVPAWSLNVMFTFSLAPNAVPLTVTVAPGRPLPLD